MRVLIVHNYYQRRGGEDVSAEQEVRLLRKRGHEVHFHSRHNDEIKTFSVFQKALLFWETSWSLKSYREMRQVVREFRPDLAQFHNFFPLISPSAYYACAEAGVPIIQFLHNYRLLCPTGQFFRNGEVCEDCLKRSLWRGIIYGCYHNSRLQTAAVALMLKTHRVLKTWYKRIDAFIALTEFSRRKFIEGGIPESKIFICPNFLEVDPGVGNSLKEYALFVGRLSSEKGLITLLEAWRYLPDVPLRIVGDGPMRKWIEEYISQNKLDNVKLAGHVAGEIAIQFLRRAFCLIVPSVWYECLPRVVVESYAVGTPVLASRLGAMAELVEEGKTGLLFQPGDPTDLTVKVKQALEQPEQLKYWGQQARYLFEQKYSSEAAYKRLTEIYEQVINR